MDENGRHGRSLGIPIHQGLDEQAQAGAGGPLNADSRHMASERNFAFLPDSSHMADSRQASGRQSAGAHKISSTAAGSWREPEEPAGTQKAARMFLSQTA